MKPELEEIYKQIIENNESEDITYEIEEAKNDFVDSDWENEYDSLDEAYDETGRGGAEEQVLGNLIESINPDLSVDDHTELFKKIASYYNILLTD
jgi:hypothetical protein